MRLIHSPELLECSKDAHGTPLLGIESVCRPFALGASDVGVDMVLREKGMLRLRARVVSQHPRRAQLHVMTYDERRMLAMYDLEVARGLVVDVRGQYYVCTRFVARFTWRLLSSSLVQQQAPVAPRPNLVLFRQLVLGMRRPEHEL